MGFWKWMRSRYDYRRVSNMNISGWVNFWAYAIGGVVGVLSLAYSIKTPMLLIPACCGFILAHWGWYREFEGEEN